MRPSIARLCILALIFATGFFTWVSSGCSGDATDKSSLEAAFLDYDETDMVNFRLSGEAKCPSCAGEEIAGLYVELVSALSPTTNLSVGTFEGTGDFYFPSLRAVADSTVYVYGTLFFEGRPESQALKAQASFKVPDDDDETAAVILQFGQ